MEGKLNTALADMEIELRKCSVDENGLVSLHHIFEQVNISEELMRAWLQQNRKIITLKFLVWNQQGKRSRFVLVKTTKTRKSEAEGSFFVGCSRSVAVAGVASVIRIH